MHGLAMGPRRFEELGAHVHSHAKELGKDHEHGAIVEDVEFVQGDGEAGPERGCCGIFRYTADERTGVP